MDYNKFYIFIKNETGIEINEVSPNYGMEKDFNIYGDEAFDFIMRFSKEFNVNIDNFEIKKYFNLEIDIISSFITNLFRKRKEKKDLTIKDLEEAVKFGKLE